MHCVNQFFLHILYNYLIQKQLRYRNRIKCDELHKTGYSNVRFFKWPVEDLW